MKSKLITILLSTLAAASIQAGPSEYYLGLSYLFTDVEFMEKTDSDSGFAASFGYKAHDYFSVEANYLDLGTWELPNIPDAGGYIESEGYGISVLGTYPIDDFTLVGKLGNLWWDSDGRLGSIAGPVSFSDDGSDLILGVGLRYSVNETFDIKIEYNDAHDFNWGTLGFNYRF